MSQLLRHFGLDRHPFNRRTPKEALYRHRGFEEASRRLLYTLELDGMAAIMASPGCGKSLLLGELADTLVGQGWTAYYFAHTTTGPFGLVNVLARKVGLSPSRSRPETAAAISARLIEDKRQHLLVIDEAHRLPDETMEDLRLLTIADYDRQSPFHLILAGRPELDDRLADPIHSALDQRITTVARLMPLSADETREYVSIRLRAAGAKDQPIFDDDAVDAIFEGADGVPRRVNTTATASMIVAAARGRRTVCTQDVYDARLDRGRDLTPRDRLPTTDETPT
jgi:type II secretory pathway predicted ATPase ExeA